MKKNKKQQARNYLQNLIKHEITLCQEILSQMAQQEYSMLAGDLEVHDQVQREAQTLVKELHILQKKRKQWIGELDQDLKGLFDRFDEIDTETPLLLEKHKTLIFNIKTQKKRNDTLYKLIQNRGRLDHANKALNSEIIYDSKKKKPLLITIDYPEETPS